MSFLSTSLPGKLAKRALKKLGVQQMVVAHASWGACA